MRWVLVKDGSESPIGAPLIARLLSQNYLLTLVGSREGCKRFMDSALVRNGISAKRRVRFVVYDPDLAGDCDFQIRESLRDLGESDCIAIIDFRFRSTILLDNISFGGLYIILTAHPLCVKDASFPSRTIIIETAPLLFGSCFRKSLGLFFPKSPQPITYVHDIVDFVSNYLLVNRIQFTSPMIVPIICSTMFDKSRIPGVPLDWFSLSETPDGTDCPRVGNNFNLFNFQATSFEEAVAKQRLFS
jgi:hypothetical protein